MGKPNFSVVVLVCLFGSCLVQLMQLSEASELEAGTPFHAKNLANQYVRRVVKWPKRDATEVYYHKLIRRDNGTVSWSKRLVAVEDKLQTLADGCASKNLLPCSGNGACVFTSSSVFGLSSRTGKQCRCQGGFYGHGCQKFLNSTQKIELREHLSGWVRRIPSRAEVGEVKFPPDDLPSPGQSVFSHHFKGTFDKVPEWVKNEQVTGSVSVENQPVPIALDHWTNMSPEQLVAQARANAEMVAKIKREPTVQSLLNKFDPLVPQEPLSSVALYTSAKGKSILGPLVYPGQKPLTKAQAENPIDKVFATSLKDLLNAMHVKNALAGAVYPVVQNPYSYN